MKVKLVPRKLKKGTTFYLHYSLNGTAHRINTGISYSYSDPKYVKQAQEQAAESKRAALQISLTYDAVGLYNPADANIDFYEYALDFAARHGSKYVKESINAALDHLQQVAGTRLPFAMITEKMLLTYRKHLDKSVSPETAYKYFYQVKRIISEAKKEKLIKENPAEYIKNYNRTTPEVKKESLTLEELNRLRNTPCQRPDVKNAMLLAAVTGMQLIDLRNLKRSQINERTMELTYYRSKNRSHGKRAVIVPIDPDVLTLVDLSKSGNLFSLPTDKHVNPHIKRWVKAAGINKKITSSCFRTTCATVLLHAGIPESTIIEILGWSDFRMIRKYARPSSDQKREAAKVFRTA